MFIRKYWVLLSVFLVLIVGVSVYYLQTRPPKDPIVIYKPVEPLPKSEEKAPVGDTSQGGHFHEDGTWHEGTHEAHEVPAAPAVQNTTPSAPRGKPFANFTPDPNDDPVAAAHKRLDYIANNLHEWGDFSPQTLELMEEMTPVPNIRKGDVIPGEGESEIAYLEELSALCDPRSAEVLLAWQMDSGLMGRPIDDALVAMGPAAVPALIARLDDLDDHISVPLDLLAQIVVKHRSELGGIVEHIILPKVEVIATSNTTYKYYASQLIAHDFNY